MTLRKHLAIEHDHTNHQWRCDLHDVAGTVLVTDHLWQMEAKLDDLENQGRLDTEVQDDVGTDEEEAADGIDWRAAEAD